MNRMDDMTQIDTSEIRPGEVSNGTEVQHDATLQFIGVIRTPFTSRDMCPRQGRLDGPECRLELLPQWLAALKGIEAYATLDVLYWLHQSRRDLVIQNPKSNDRTVGTFALRSPVRPNPIGVSRVALVRVEASGVVVKGLDCLDKTPLIDIKPNRCEFTPQAPEKAADR